MDELKKQTYYIGNNGMEYVTPEDAVRYGNGLKGTRETTVEVKTTTYSELTGQKPPESPVDHVLTMEMPKKPIEYEQPKQEAVIQAPEKVEVVNIPFVQTPPVVSAPATLTTTPIPEIPVTIVATEPEKPVETPQVAIDLNSLTDDQLRAMCRQRKFMGSARMRRENMIRKLS